jgi:septum formation protein
MQPQKNSRKIDIILASNSPRRKDLLRQIGIIFTSNPTDIDERVLPGEKPEVYVQRVALDKALIAAKRAKAGIVIAADTIVVLDDTILGKPTDDQDAVRMLTMLSGGMHRVISGVVVMDAVTGRTLTRTSITQVWFRVLSDDEIRSYVATGEPRDKAGAYGIQEKGSLFVDRVEGCYFNVVGLPVSLLGEMLKAFNIDIMTQLQNKL